MNWSGGKYPGRQVMGKPRKKDIDVAVHSRQNGELREASNMDGHFS